MRINKLTQALFGMGALCVAGQAFALEAWNGQEGSEQFNVIFNNSVYQNAWWVGADQCPGNAQQDQATNPWRLSRGATAQEISQYGNPTNCEIAGGNDSVNLSEFSQDQSYSKDEKVQYNGATYKTNELVSAHSYIPGKENPWKIWQATPEWENGKVYNAGDIVTRNGQSYEALFYTNANDPALAENQNPTKNNGKPWYPLGASSTVTQAQANAAPALNLNTLYDAGALMTWNGTPYIAQWQVKDVTPEGVSPWRAYVEWGNTKERVGTPKSAWPKQFYAPYVDFTLNSIPDLASVAQSNNVTHYTLAFVVSKDADTCMPTWGTAYSMGDYAQYSKIKALREAGGDVMVSIGGANNSPLAASCKNVADLQQHYYDIVDNLNLKVLDFDIEGTWVADHESIGRRNQAVKAVQDQWKKEGRQVAIWYTLPILPTGLTPEGIYVLQDAKAKGVELDGVNVMTMDYGNIQCQSDGTEGQNIHGKCATDAVDNLFKQVKAIWPEKSDNAVYAMLGTTPMIGYNDVQGEVFYMSDAHHVYQHAKDHGIGMIGAWSMMRDRPGIEKQVSPEHSGMTEQQAPLYAYSNVFAPFTQNSANPNQNHPPVAYAGISQQIDKAGVVTLDASGSSDQDGDSLTWQWEQLSGPAVKLSNANAAKATFTVASPLVQASYSFRVTVNDGKQSSHADTTVTVTDPNQPVKPALSVATMQQVNAGSQVTIVATATDPDSTAQQLKWHWTLPAGVGQVSGQDTNTLTIIEPADAKEASYALQVKVTDQSGLSANGEVTLQVHAAAQPDPTPAPAGDYDYVYPDGLASYTDGTKVLAADGSIYQCKPFPYSGWCAGAAWAYAPATGSNWQDAWDKR
ncbi:Ig-like domain-containing protein [Scandinavium sp. M-37]|uniref:PKD domain-containing protein n=1 Tax=Scandinavium sp. M-37 TaxID=3373077 RepID=UPI0037475FB7